MGNLDPRDAWCLRIGILLVFIFCVILPVSIALSWLALLLSYAGFTSWPAVPTEHVLVVYFFVSFAIICVLLWLGAQVGVIKLEKTAQNIIASAFVITALGAVVTFFSKLSK